MTHRPISELLPWYVNDTLTLEERTAVEAEVERCAECATEVEQLAALRDYMLETDAAIEGPSQTLFAKTLARIEREEHAPRRVGKLWAALAGLSWLLVAAPVVAAVVVVGFWAFGPGGRFAVPVSAVAPPEQPQSVTLDTYSASASAGAQIPMARNKVSVVGAITAPTVAARRDIVRTGAISLVVDDVERAINLADSVASQRGGYVSSLSDQTPQAPGERHSAEMQVSVPSAQFDGAMISLAALGVVRSRSVNAQDVTSNVVDLTARLDNARRTERDLAAIMDRQGKIDDILQAEQQLAQAREQVEQLAGQLQAQQQSVALSTIDLTLTDAAPKPSAAAPSGSDQLGDAWRAAVRSVGSFTLAIVSSAFFIVAYVPYIALVLILAWLAWRRFAGQTSRRSE